MSEEEAKSQELRGGKSDIMAKIISLKKEAIALQQANPAAAIDYFLKVLEISRQSGDTGQTIEILAEMAVCHSALSNYNIAIQVLAEARALVSFNTPPAIVQRIKNSLAVNYYYLGRHQEARELFEEILREHLSQGDIHSTRMVLINLTNIYQHLGDFSKALECSFTSLEICLEIGDEYRAGLNYGNLGMIYIELGEWEKAEDFLLKSLEIRRKRNDRSGEARIMSNLSKVSQHKGKMQEAFEYAVLSVSLRDAIGDRSGMAKTLLGLGELHHVSANNTLAMKCFSRALSLAECFAAIGQWQQAYENHRIFKKLEDEIKNTEKHTAIAEMQSFYEADTARRESEILKQKNSELAALNKKLEELTVEKDNIIGIVAHELKNPLQGLHLMAELLERYSDRLNPDEVRINAVKSLKTIDHMSGIIKNLLDIHEFESGKVEIVWSKVNFSSLIRSVVHDFQPQILTKNIALDFETIEDDAFINADKTLLRQIFENILSNAIKFSPAGKHIFIELSKANDTVSCAVRDEGPGMTEEDLKKVFGKFARLSARPTGGETSTGLGLSIVKKLTEVLKGEVCCSAIVGEGATFTTVFPAFKN